MKLDLTKLIKLRQMCNVKGCCWDDTKAQFMTVQKNFDMVNDMLAAHCPYRDQEKTHFIK